MNFLFTSHHHFLPKLLRAIAWFLIIGVLKMPLGNWPAFEAKVEDMRNWGYSKMMRQFQPDAQNRLPVKIVDVTGVPHPLIPNNPRFTAIDRDQLFKVIEKIAAQKPRAIGVDYNFALEADGSNVTLKDQKFFTDIIALKAKTGVPIYLGAFPRPGSVHADFGSPTFNQLAAAIPVPRGGEPENSDNNRTGADAPPNSSEAGNQKDEHEVKEMPLWYRPEGLPPRQTMAAALVGASFDKPSEFDPTSVFKWGFEYYFDSTPIAQLLVRSILIDESVLPLLETQKITWREVMQSVVTASSLNDSFVLVGDATRDATSNPADSFRTVNDTSKIPGVYLHASATYSALQSPLYRVTPQFTLALDIFLALLIFFLALGLELWLHRYRLAEHWIELLIILATSAVIIATAIVLVYRTRAMWDDFVVVIAWLIVEWLFCFFRDKSWAKYRRQQQPSPDVTLETKQPEPISTAQQTNVVIAKPGDSSPTNTHTQ